LGALWYANRDRIAGFFEKEEVPKEEKLTSSLSKMETSVEKKEPLPQWQEDDRSSQKKTLQKPHVYTKLIPESENIDLDCFTYFKGMRLLVVEDNLINQKIIQNVLKHSGKRQRSTGISLYRIQRL